MSRFLLTSRPSDYAEIALIVYELHGSSPLNALTEAGGLGGAYHVGVEAFWLEWSYGYAPEGTGIACCHVGTSSLGSFKERVPLGRTLYEPPEFIDILTSMRASWQGLDYDLLSRNCAHFAVALVRRLGVTDAPDWIYSLADVGERLAQALGARGARAAADACTPPDRLPPPLAALSEDDLGELVDEGDWNAAVEIRWRQAQEYILELYKQSQLAVRFEDIVVEICYSAAARLGPRNRESQPMAKLATVLANDKEFRALCHVAAAAALGTRRRKIPGTDYLEFVGLTNTYGQVLLLRFRFRSSEWAPDIWPTPGPPPIEFERLFLGSLRGGAALSEANWPQGTLNFIESLHVLSAPGQPKFGSRAMTCETEGAPVVFASEHVHSSRRASSARSKVQARRTVATRSARTPPPSRPEKSPRPRDATGRRNQWPPQEMTFEQYQQSLAHAQPQECWRRQPILNPSMIQVSEYSLEPQGEDIGVKVQSTLARLQHLKENARPAFGPSFSMRRRENGAS